MADFNEVRAEPADHDGSLRRRATYASVAVAVTLIVAKLSAYLFTESVSILSSLIDSSSDLLASLVTLFGVRVALRPPDRSHRYGHGKAEPLAALAQAAFVTGSAVFLSYEAINRLINPQPIQEGIVGIAVMILSIVLTIGLVAFQRRVIRQTGSLAIGAGHRGTHDHQRYRHQTGRSDFRARYRRLPGLRRYSYRQRIARYADGPRIAARRP
jgi:ferrous-iron efflux pump FieF